MRFEPGRYELVAGGQTLVAQLTAVEVKRIRDAACAAAKPGGRPLTFRALDVGGLRRDVANTRENSTAAAMLSTLAALKN